MRLDLMLSVGVVPFLTTVGLARRMEAWSQWPRLAILCLALVSILLLVMLGIVSPLRGAELAAPLYQIAVIRPSRACLRWLLGRPLPDLPTGSVTGDFGYSMLIVAQTLPVIALLGSLDSFLNE